MLLAVVPAAMAYPWRATNERWILGIAIGVVVVLLSWWRGLPVTSIARRRLSLLAGRAGREPGAHTLVDRSAADARTTAVLRVLHDRDGELPLPLIAEYLDRYGIRCETVRVTSRDTPVGRSTWIGLTVSAAANLAALQARSADIPLRETAEIAARRLADHLRELGWAISTTDVDIPDLLGPQVTERWRGVQDGAHGYIAAYAAPAQPDTLAQLWSDPVSEVWTVLQFSGSGDEVLVSVACAVRSDDLPAAPPVPGLIAQHGAHRTALAALHPLSTGYVVAPTVSWQSVAGLRWPASRIPVRT
ncbi:type VII secretion protein EccE [Mycolicibacterium komossense]|uniref:Type VII secretion protein EccE n=1 Tax=Mycolicibacterium komossense TaxID=1779 RepID=A0ABT3CFL4_9MYCO|nr:type VII secretion protein EccE [Mycolicibacterium komossense]